MSFGATLNVLLMTLLFMVPGYIFCKCRKLDPEKLPALSVTLLYITAADAAAVNYKPAARAVPVRPLRGLFYV